MRKINSTRVTYNGIDLTPSIQSVPIDHELGGMSFCFLPAGQHYEWVRFKWWQRKRRIRVIDNARLVDVWLNTAEPTNSSTVNTRPHHE